MSVEALAIIVIAASGVLMMRFRKRWLANRKSELQGEGLEKNVTS
jgi:cell division protein FtsL